MSAFVVTPKHINAIVFSGVHYGSTDYGISYMFRGELKRLTAKNAQEIAQLLYTANVRSVNYRYNERARSAGFVYKLDADFLGMPPIAALKLIESLEYQSCERPDWAKSEAKAVLNAITSVLIGRIAGYNSAPWSI